MKYRPISIMPVNGKIFAKCIAEIIEPLFNFHANQFGFLDNVGVTMRYLHLGMLSIIL